ncbi:radical SAM family heme chaperone HemW [Paraferrimonas sp. SM1919]|uniref:radical SAM family heme chaperone HemW n=1 Tax=Paraferrimonas sp. SM1919 TaxID=2662263 RepID=UPI0013D6BD59|nr:radical SAM family heme chaperone HemW [Paraferrimonas sp. SM1919]
MLTLPPLSLYIHIPWCVKKCPYCDFNSHAQNGELPRDEYMAALLEDLKQDQHLAQGRSIATIFIGGGTPSLMTGAWYKELFSQIHAIVPIADDAEITMEANPGTLEYDSFDAYVAAGINRISMGVQSFDSDKLARLGRIHSGAEAITAAQGAASSGLKSFNLDLMHGLPNQSFEEAMNDIKKAASLNPPHISWYQLTIEPNTLFHSKPPTLPDDDDLWDIYDQGRALLSELGYEQYEVSAYAKKGYQCRHNINYWEFGDYLGIGCGAHGKITLPQSDTIMRTEKIKHPKGYLSNIEKLYRKSPIEPEDRALEYLMNRARLVTPFTSSDFSARTGIEAQILNRGLQPSIDKGLIRQQGEQWQLTSKGQLFVNDILDPFLISD